jgi:hypothetical protein
LHDGFIGGKVEYIPKHLADHDDMLGKDPGAIKIISEERMSFSANWMETLIGLDLEFYGAESQAFKVDGVVFEVLCDPDDGYRSYMGGVIAHNPEQYNFYSQPLATVRLEKFNREEDEESGFPESTSGFQLIDTKDDHVWLEFGTHHHDEWYPVFIFRYMLKDEAQ